MNISILKLKLKVICGVVMVTCCSLLFNAGYHNELRDIVRHSNHQNIENANDKHYSISKLANFSQSNSKTTLSTVGIVIPLFEEIATMGLSLIYQLRNFGIEVPIEIPHCGDLNETTAQLISQATFKVEVYDVCEEAFKKGWERDIENREKGKFCLTLEECYREFRNFYIKILGLLFSKYDEIILMDADILFFQNPLQLLDLQEYKSTGTIFFHDRIASSGLYLNQDISGISALQEFIYNADVSFYRNYSIVPRAPPKSNAYDKANFHFVPSAQLLNSHCWNRRSDHMQDSALVFWNKRLQPRATAILAGFIVRGGSYPAGYGDKENYFIACELAETEYFFSPWACGAMGETPGARETGDFVCGDALHMHPSASSTKDALFINGDKWINWSMSTEFYSKTRRRNAQVFPGTLESRGLHLTCPFGFDIVHVSDEEQKEQEQRKAFFVMADAILKEHRNPR